MRLKPIHMKSKQKNRWNERYSVVAGTPGPVGGEVGVPSLCGSNNGVEIGSSDASGLFFELEAFKVCACFFLCLACFCACCACVYGSFSAVPRLCFKPPRRTFFFITACVETDCVQRRVRAIHSSCRPPNAQPPHLPPRLCTRPQGGSVSFAYMFASEEYLEYTLTRCASLLCVFVLFCGC